MKTAKVVSEPETIKDTLAKIVGVENVVDDEKVLQEYSKDYSFVEPRKPMFIVYPKNTEEVQKMVKWANENGIPLTPVSSGPPRFRGDTIPSHGGIIIDLSKMKKILKIDPRNRIVMVEPGVTFKELIPELEKHGLRLAGPLLPRASKSVITSCLEREPTIMPKYQWDHIDPLFTLNVVFGTGDVMRTGSASGPGPLERLATDLSCSLGPGQADFCRFLTGAQGTMGVVTWATIRTELLPRLQRLYFIPSQRIEGLIECIYRFMKWGFGGVCNECFILNNFNLAVILTKEWLEEFGTLRENLPPWVLITCLGGYRRPEEIVEIREKYLMTNTQELGLTPTLTLPGAPGKERRMLELLSKPWTEEPYWKLRYKGSCQELFFLTTLNRIPEFIESMCRLAARHGYPTADIGVYIQPIVKGTACHCEFDLPYNPDIPREVETVRRLFTEASETFTNMGAFFSRPYNILADIVYGRYAEGVRVLREIKRIFDPNNIMNPGKLCF